MSDLISRKALLEDMQSSITEQSDTFDWINLINSQPIAYDVDKVVEQLEICKNSFPFGTWHDMVEEAVSIVKGGGRDE